MNDITVPDALRDELPADLDLARAAITTYRELCDAHDVETAHRVDVDDDAVVVIAPGYIATDDGGWNDEHADAESAAEAAQDYVDGGGWDDVDSTSWVHVYAWRRGYVLDEDGDLVQLTIDREQHTIALEPDEPECDAADGHDWQSPYEVLGGLKENPGVWGNGGGVIIREVCAHCGRYRVTDTWAQDRSTGEQGLTSIKYEDADEASERWAAASKPETQMLALIDEHGVEAVTAAVAEHLGDEDVSVDHDGEVCADRWLRGDDLVPIVDAVREALDD